MADKYLEQKYTEGIVLFQCKGFEYLVHSRAQISTLTIQREMKYMRRTAGYTWTDHKTNTQIAKELKITPILDKLQEYKRNWIHHVNRMPCNRLPRVMKQYSPTGRRNHSRPLKRLLDAWDRNGSTSGPTAWKTDDDDESKRNFHIKISVKPI